MSDLISLLLKLFQSAKEKHSKTLIWCVLLAFTWHRLTLIEQESYYYSDDYALMLVNQSFMQAKSGEEAIAIVDKWRKSDSVHRSRLSALAFICSRNDPRLMKRFKTEYIQSLCGVVLPSNIMEHPKISFSNIF